MTDTSRPEPAPSPAPDEPAAAAVVVEAVIVEQDVAFSLDDLARACRGDAGRLLALVDEGVLRPSGGDPGQWRFEGDALRRARAALRLGRDFELAPPATALVLDLLEEVHALRARLRAAGLAP